MSSNSKASGVPDGGRYHGQFLARGGMTDRQAAERRLVAMFISDGKDPLEALHAARQVLKHLNRTLTTKKAVSKKSRKAK